MSEVVLGIDLGTTNSVVAIADGTDVRVLVDEAGSRLIPSVVSFHPDGRILVGAETRDRRLVDAANTVYSVKRLIGRPFASPEVEEAAKRFAFKLKQSANGGVLAMARNDSYTLTEISAFVLREVKRIAELNLGVPVTKAVITVPAAFNELQRSATKAAGRVAGLEVLRIVNEPTAAALAYGMGRTRRERVAIYDLGGGTFDLTLLELENDVFEVLASAGDSYLGGDDVDQRIADVMADAFLAKHRADPRTDQQALDRVRAAAEWLKCALSTQETATARVDELMHGKKGAALHLEHTMTRRELEALAEPLVERSLTICRDALAEAKLTAADLDSVILVGGSTRMPLVSKRVGDLFGLDPRSTIDPDVVVAQGAAIHGFSLGRRKGGDVARVALKRLTVDEVMSARKKRDDARAAGPKQNAFAPMLALDEPMASPARAPGPAPGAAAKPAPKPPIPRPPAKPGIAAKPRDAAAKGAVVTAPAMPVLPKPKPRMSTIPPAPPRPIEVPTLNAAATSPKAVPARPKARTLELDAAFGPEAELGREIAALDTAVQRASLHPPPPRAASPTQASGSDGLSGLLVLDDLDDPLGPPPPAPPAPRAKAPEPAPTPEPVRSPTPPARFPPPMPPPPPAPTFDGAAAAASAPPEEEDDLAFFFGDDEPETPAASDAQDAEPEFGEPEPEFAAPEPEPVDFFALPAAPAEAPRAQVAAAAPAPALPMTTTAAPLLLDTTPFSLGVETVGGYCQTIIRRNVPIPCEQTRSFTTGGDRQSSVVIRICQGESRLVAENQLLGTVELSGLEAAARGRVRIAVTFELDASGILDVRAVDESTGEQRSIRIKLLGGATDDEIEAMRARQQRLVGGPS